MSDLTASELLTAYDKFMSGAPISQADEATARAVAIAACFGVAAYDAQPHRPRRRLDLERASGLDRPGWKACGEGWGMMAAAADQWSGWAFEVAA